MEFPITRFNRVLPVFMSHVQPHGLLPPDMRANACWYYCRIALGHFKQIDEGSVYVGERDRSEGLKNLVMAVAIMYRIADPDDYLRFLPLCKQEAEACGMEWDVRIEHPAAGTFIQVSN